MAAKKVIQNTERARWKHDAQSFDNSLQRLPERSRSGYSAKHNKNHGRKREKHVEGNCLRQCNATGNYAKDSSIESTKKR